MIRIVDSSQVSKLLSRKAARFADAEQAVRPILDAVRTRGDKALMEYARKFDKLDRKSPRVSADELKAAEAQLAPAFRKAVEVASKNIRAFAKLQMPVAKSASMSCFSHLETRTGMRDRRLSTVWRVVLAVTSLSNSSAFSERDIATFPA